VATYRYPTTVRNCTGSPITEYVVETENGNLADLLAAASDWVRDHPNDYVADISKITCAGEGETYFPDYLSLIVHTSNPGKSDRVTYR
jgi:hypothetical protein